MTLSTPDVVSSLGQYDSCPKVVIFLATYQGGRYLANQLESFEKQCYPNWEVFASDDGSEDNTIAILEAYQKKWSPRRLSIEFGPSAGFAANFLFLVLKASVKSNYYAFSDQDDIWEADKLERAVRCLETIPSDTPALYCSRSRLINAGGKLVGLSPLMSRPPSFANALVQSIGGGNTMVFNHAARELLREVSEETQVVFHDWWTYLVVTGCGGKVIYDDYPSLRYRQHDGNLLGMNSSWPDRLRRIRMMWEGHFRGWNDCNIKGLRKLQCKLTPANRQTLEHFANARQMRLIPRLVYLKRIGIYRQNWLGQLYLIIAAIFKKI